MPIALHHRSVQLLIKTQLDKVMLKMESENKKQRPPHVPEENVYKSIHWTIILAYAIAAFAIYLLLSSTT